MRFKVKRERQTMDRKGTYESYSRDTIMFESRKPKRVKQVSNQGGARANEGWKIMCKEQRQGFELI
jgi:hypothetical protein